jgi:hypothetical protein
MLKFDTFQESPIIEGYKDLTTEPPSLEYNKITIPQNTDTYLDKYSKLVANEEILLAMGADLEEHLDALQYCNLIQANIDNNAKIQDRNGQMVPLTYTINNKYINVPNTSNVYLATNAGKPEKCETIQKWNTNKNPSAFNGIVDLNFNTNNFGVNLATDLSYINVLLTTSNQYVKDISDNYAKQIPEGKNYDDIIKMYNNNVRLRKNLDQKMSELYNGDQTIAMYQKKSLDSVVYANILWTVLATSLIYYVFVKI